MVLAVVAPPPVHAADQQPLPIPRFAALRSDLVNMRAGPGERYPIAWSYNRRDLPVEIVDQFDVWRKIRDPNGTEGWVHQQMLTGHRMGYVTLDRAKLFKSADEASGISAGLQQGVLVKLLKCPKQSSFCKVETGGYQGWIKRSDIWGIYPAESIE